MFTYSIITTIILISIPIYFLVENKKTKRKKAIELMVYEGFYTPKPTYDKKQIDLFFRNNTFIVTARNTKYDNILSEKIFVKKFKKAFSDKANTHYTYFNQTIKFVISFDCSEDMITETLKNFAKLYPDVYFGISQCIKKESINRAIALDNRTPNGKKIVSHRFSNGSLKALNMGIFNKQQVYRFDVGETKVFSKFTQETEAMLWSAFNSKNIEQLTEIIQTSFESIDSYAQCMYVANNLLHFLHTVLGKNNITIQEVYGDNVNLYRWMVDVLEKKVLVGCIHNWYKKAITYIEEHSEKINDIEIKIEKYIEDNYAKEISTTTMAEEFKVSTQYFSKYFKLQTGSNFLETVNRYRIKKALEMLNDTKLPLSEIAAMTGFTNYKSFARNFKKYTGKIPSEYLKK